MRNNSDVQMDPKVAWIQPEVFGPATELWQRLWENSNRESEEYNNQVIDQTQKPNTSNLQQLSEAQREQQLQKENRLQAELGIKQLSPLSQLISSDNAACMISLDYQQIVRNYQQNGKWRRQKYPGGLYGLHLEIMDFYDWIKPTNEEYIMRYHVVNRYEHFFFS